MNNGGVASIKKPGSFEAGKKSHLDDYGLAVVLTTLLAGLLLPATALLAALSWLLAWLARFLSTTALLAALSWLLARLARFLSAAALLTALSRLTSTLVLLARFVVGIHDCSMF